MEKKTEAQNLRTTMSKLKIINQCHVKNIAHNKGPKRVKKNSLSFKTTKFKQAKNNKSKLRMFHKKSSHNK